MYLFYGTGERYEQNGYKNNGKDVPNIDLIKKLLSLKRTYNINLLKIRAHTRKKDIHSNNNEVADKLANQGAFSTIEQNKSGFNGINSINNLFKIDLSDDDDNYSYKINSESINEIESSDDEFIEEPENKKIFFKTKKEKILNDKSIKIQDNLEKKEDITEKKSIKLKSKKNNGGIKDIQMNELFEFDELEENEEGTTIKTSRKNKSTKTLKLSNWFVKIDVDK
jgi:predicted xylose isomerase-like sugar epimerase